MTEWIPLRNKYTYTGITGFRWSNTQIKTKIIIYFIQKKKKTTQNINILNRDTRMEAYHNLHVKNCHL